MKNDIINMNSCCNNIITGKDIIQRNEDWIERYKDTNAGKIPVISTSLTMKDIRNGWKVRWGIGRNNYTIAPGLYAVGDPTEESPVLVTANYKLTFDKLRKTLSKVSAWILALDTRGINVWCAAGKGTFGTEELIKQIKITGLSNVVNHRKIILPQLGAPGVAAHFVKQETGFRVLYGPVYSIDIENYLNNNLVKTKEMSKVHFRLMERLAVIPVELIQSTKYILITFLVVGIITALWEKTVTLNIIINFIPYFGAFIAGLILVPALLPFIPFRSFSLKGLFTGLLWSVIVYLIYNPDILTAFSYFLILPPVAAFLAMNYTGASTFTSPAGAKLEVKYTFIPAAAAIFSGIILRGIGAFI
ncbi:MAG: acetyl-CoA synthase subunit gamma [Spirochaetes bacterium]|nr:acetyl-CoA synthase subunit gamma [Spirochaetota bacterium]